MRGARSTRRWSFGVKDGGGTAPAAARPRPPSTLVTVSDQATSGLFLVDDHPTGVFTALFLLLPRAPFHRIFCVFFPLVLIICPPPLLPLILLLRFCERGSCLREWWARRRGCWERRLRYNPQWCSYARRGRSSIPTPRSVAPASLLALAPRERFGRHSCRGGYGG